MTSLEAVQERHSVRSYEKRSLEDEDVAKLEAYIMQINKESGLGLRLITDEPLAFGSFKAHYGKFSGVTDYIAVSGGKGMSEKAGYYGEKAVLYAQTLGLRTCWVALTYKKNKSMLTQDKLYVVIAIGYGKDDGVMHKSKGRSQVTDLTEAPDWFWDGIDAALLAPTAMNQQKFRFSLDGDKVTCSKGHGFYTGIDLGIAMLHFELGSGKEGCFRDLL